MSTTVPATARIAVQSAPLKIEVRELAIPQIGPDQALVRVDACGICGTDVNQYRYDSLGLLPAHLGHEGTGTVVRLGADFTHDWDGNPLTVGDQIVTGPKSCGRCHVCVTTPEKGELCEAAAIHGLVAGEDGFLAGWFGEYIVVDKQDAVFRVTGLSLEMRVLVEPAAVVVHALERAKAVHDFGYGSTVLVQGAGPIGLMLTALLRSMGIATIIAVDPVGSRLELARRLGASATVAPTPDPDPVAAVLDLTNGRGADVVFQCTGSPHAATTAWRFVRRGGTLVELGFFADTGDATYNPHRDVCNKEITVVGSWAYRPQDWSQAGAFMREAMARRLPLEELVTHRYGVDQVNEAMQTCMARTGIKVVIQP